MHHWHAQATERLSVRWPIPGLGIRGPCSQVPGQDYDAGSQRPSFDKHRRKSEGAFLNPKECQRNCTELAKKQTGEAFPCVSDSPKHEP